LVAQVLNCMQPQSPSNMLKQRILTALVLFAILAGVLTVQSPWPFFIFLSIACGLAGWEWARLTIDHKSMWPIALGVTLFLLTLLQAFFWLERDSSFTLLVTISAVISVGVWLCCVSVALVRAQVSVILASIPWTVFAFVNLFATWGVLALLYQQHGVTYVVSLLALIWIADIAAYFAGRSFGRHKLAPAISPGKTLEGALAGVLGVVAWVVFSAQWSGTFGAALTQEWGLVVTILLAVVLAIFSICGDLFESLLKRRAGVKDSSNLLPGHGGVYDRIDAVVAVVPLAFVLTEVLSW
jgi:phosphatidate cytidylyltransferase